jgi:hypothetical protein
MALLELGGLVTPQTEWHPVSISIKDSEWRNLVYHRK